jgi:hypothetical protein
MISIISISVKTVKDHSIEWLNIVALTPVVYLLLKTRKQGFIQKWISRLLLKRQLKDRPIDKTKPRRRIFLSLLLALGLGLLFTLVTAWPAAVAVGIGAFLLGMLVIFKPVRRHHPEIF